MRIYLYIRNSCIEFNLRPLKKLICLIKTLEIRYFNFSWHIIIKNKKIISFTSFGISV